jgi:hypothetical protein
MVDDAARDRASSQSSIWATLQLNGKLGKGTYGLVVQAKEKVASSAEDPKIFAVKHFFKGRGEGFSRDALREASVHRCFEISRASCCRSSGTRTL